MKIVATNIVSSRTTGTPTARAKKNCHVIWAKMLINQQMSPLGLRKHQNSSSLVFEKLTLFVGKSRSSVPPSAYLPACLNKLLYKDILRLLWEDIFHFVLNQEEIWQKMFWSKIAHFHTLYNTKYDIECF